jgi:hypothetical protein
MDFSIQDNWSEVPGYRGKALSWEKQQGASKQHILHTTVEKENWWIRLNDFPDEPLCTLIVDGYEIIHFNDWPPEWKK